MTFGAWRTATPAVTLPGMEGARAYLLTFRTYGTWLPGDPRGTVDRGHRLRGTPLAPPRARREAYAMSLMHQPPVILSRAQRAAVRDAIRDLCASREWVLHALAVQTNHVHVVVALGRHQNAL